MNDPTAYIEACAEDQFSWNWHNCAHFTARWVLTVEGEDVLGSVADCVDSLLGAARRVESLGGLLAATDKIMNRKRILASMAQIGDIVAIADGERRLLGICCGRTAAFLGAERGIVHVGMEAVLAAWPVGRKE